MRCPVCLRCIEPGSSCVAHPAVRIPGTNAAAPAAPAISGYLTGEYLGGGGFSSVFAATRQSDGVALALKIAHRGRAQRLHREAACMELLKETGVTPRPLDVGTTDDDLGFLAMELLLGSPLDHWIGSHQTAPVSVRIELLHSLASAVDQMHAAGVLHRDLKPENAMVCDGHVRLIDFGLARRRDDAPPPPEEEPRLTRTGTRLGTALYMAPEQFSSAGTVDFRADLYSLGVLAFELLCGAPPFMGTAAEIEQAHMSLRPPRLSLNAEVSQRADAVIDRALAKEPDQRFSSGAKLAAALGEACTQARITRRAQPEQTAANITWGTRDVALLAIEGMGGAPPELRSLVAVHGGVLCRVAAPYTIVALPAMAADDAVRRAVRIANDHNWPHTIIHVAPLRVRKTTRGTRVAGEAILRSDEWMREIPADSATVLTRAAVQVLPEQECQPVGDGRYWSWQPVAAPGAETTVFVGREALLGILAQAAADALADGSPYLVTLTGEPGVGKSRSCAAIATRLRSRWEVCELQPRSDAHQGPHAPLAQLACAAFRLSADCTAEALNEVLHASLGRAPTAAERSAAALALGRSPGAHTETGTILRAPGALRATAARIIADGLRYRAQQQPTAVIVDDAHNCDPITLDALELAAMSAGRPLFVCVAANSELVAARPTWSHRALHAIAQEIPPLQESAARVMLRDALRPVEYLADELLARLLNASHGVPSHIVDLAHALRLSGAIKQLPGTRSWTVELDDRLLDPATSLADRLLDHALIALPPNLREFAELCAVADEPLNAEDLAELQRYVTTDERQLPIDPGVGLARLARLELLVPDRAEPKCFRFRQPLLRARLEARLDVSVRKQSHTAVLAVLDAAPTGADRAARRIARHAAGCGDAARAAAAFIQYAAESARMHQYAAAERSFTAALPHLGEECTIDRAIALAGRGRMRYRLWKLVEARADFDAAIELAQRARSTQEVANLLLDQATVLDWSYDFSAAAELVERAKSIASSLADPPLQARCDLADGRTAFRRERVDDAIQLLGDAARKGAALEDYEVRCIGLLLLGPTLVYAGRLDEAQATFASVVEECEAAGDQFHLAAALVNRMFLWLKLGDWDRATGDAEQAATIARQLGNAQIERGALFNLAELLGWLGQFDEAISRADRCRELQLAYCETFEPEISLLCARLRSLRGEHETAAELLAWIDEHCAESEEKPSQQVLRNMVRLRCAASTQEQWDEVLAAAREHAVLDEHLEVMYAHAEYALRTGWEAAARRTIQEAAALEEVTAHWLARFGQLDAQLR